MTQFKKSLRESALPVAIAVCIGSLGLFHGLDAEAEEGSGATTNAPSSPAQQNDRINSENEQWAVHGQVTNIAQKHSALAVPYSGANSLSQNSPIEETTDITLFVGRRLWRGAEAWLDAEIDQGFGFDNTLGIAGFPNGGAYKVGANVPYFRLPKAFVRQTIALGGDEEKIEAAANQLASTGTADNVTLTIGKFAVTDIFDNNAYAHDTRADFMNWSIIDAGSFDYAADSWGYTFGATVEWNQAWWTLRAGYFQLSTIPNGKVAGIDFSENSINLEAEERHQWLGHPGKVKLLAWVNHGSMGSYRDAVQLGLATATTPDMSRVRRVGSRPGIVLNVEQELASGLGVFARWSANRGDKEAYEFTDINQSISAGLSLKGDRWGRHDDTVGVAAVANRISGTAQQYFGAGGLGILVGDGQLNYRPERILEMYYSLHVNVYASVALDYQYVANPAYNQDRGPVSIYGVRLHAAF